MLDPNLHETVEELNIKQLYELKEKVDFLIKRHLKGIGLLEWK